MIAPEQHFGSPNTVLHTGAKTFPIQTEAFVRIIKDDITIYGKSEGISISREYESPLLMESADSLGKIIRKAITAMAVISGSLFRINIKITSGNYMSGVIFILL